MKQRSDEIIVDVILWNSQMDGIYKCLTKRISDLFGSAMVIVFAFAPVKGNISF